MDNVTMNDNESKLAKLNAKFHGLPVDLKAWEHPVFGTPPNIGFGLEAKFSDGHWYGVKGTLVIESMAQPHEMRKAQGVFGLLKDVRITDAYEWGVADGAERFADDIENLLAPLVGLPAKAGETMTVRNNVCPWDITEVIRRNGTRAELDAAWEKVKRELVHYLACKFELPEPPDLSEKPVDMEAAARKMEGRNPRNLTELRIRMEHVICSANPSWIRSGSWVDLRNQMVDEMFDRVGVILPAQAHELNYMFNGRKPTTWTRVLGRKRK